MLTKKGFRVSVWLQILHGNYPCIALFLWQILARRLNVLSSSIASFSTPIDKAEYPKIQDLRDQIRRYLAEPFTHNMHTTSLIIPDLSPVISSSSITSFSTPVEEGEWAKICDLYLRNGLAAWLQISYHTQPCVPLWKTSIGCTKFYPGASRHYPCQ